MEQTLRILIAEVSSVQRVIIQNIIEALSSSASGLTFNFQFVAKVAEALTAISQQKPDLILSSLSLEDAFGIDIVVQLHQFDSTIPIIVLTGTNDEEIAIKAVQKGAQDFVAKKNMQKDLTKHAILYAIERGRLLSEVEFHKNQMEVLATKLSKYLPPQVYASIFSGKSEVRIGASKKYLTICFTDIVQFTQISESMGISTFSRWLNNYLNAMANVTLSFGGTLDKFMGDGIMVFFGDPETQGESEDAVQCVLMAMEMLKTAKLLGIDIRIGINSGFCTVGNFGSESRMDYTIIGREVNLASRLESNSEKNKILISSTTYDLIKDSIECETRGEIQVKGIDQPIKTYWAKQKKTS